MWNWKEAAFLSSVSRYLGELASSQVTLSILLLCPLWVALVPPWCRWLPSSLLRLLGAASAGGRTTPLTGHNLGVNRGVRRLLSPVIILESTVGYVGSGVTPTMRTRRFFEHSTCGSLVRVM